MNNYRIEFYFNRDKKQNPEITYPIIKHIKELARQADITNFWYFYEPCIEITWLSDDSKKSEILFEEIEKYLKSLMIVDYRRKYPKDGEFADWFCCSEEEREFGAKRHSLCSDFVDLYHEYKDSIDNGKGLRKQIERTIHTLCNPLGISYKDEYKLSKVQTVSDFNQKTLRVLFNQEKPSSTYKFDYFFNLLFVKI